MKLFEVKGARAPGPHSWRRNGRVTSCQGDNLLSVGSLCMYNKYELSNVTRSKDNTEVPKFNEGPLAHSRSVENVPIRISLRASALLNE